MNLSILDYGEKMETENSQLMTGDFKIQNLFFEFWVLHGKHSLLMTERRE